MIKKCLLLIIAVVTFTAQAVAAADKLDPFTAEFTVLENDASVWSDIRVVLDFSIHNGDPGSLVGSKFICLQDIDSVNITDGNGRRLPYTVKKYPRKRLIWEYGPAKDGKRRARISFVMRDAVKREKGSYDIKVDWIGGWTRPVRNVRYSVTVPARVGKKKVIAAIPKNYSMKTGQDSTTFSYSFPELKTKSLHIVLKADGIAPKKKAEKKKPGKGYVLKNIRYAPRNKTTDRLVFDLNKKTPHKIQFKPETETVTVNWKVPIQIGEKARKRKSIKSRYVKDISWKKASNKRMTCTIRLKNNGLRIKYGALPNPSRVYIDIAPDTRAKKKPGPAQEKATATKKTPPAEKSVSKKPAPQTVAAPEKKTAQVEDRLEEQSVFKGDIKVPIQQKLAYLKAQKLFKRKEFMKALDAYEQFITQYPDSVLKEAVLYDMAESNFGLAKDVDRKYYDTAIRSFKKALANFPRSDRAPMAAFLIAEAHRMREFYIEAKSQYDLVIKRFPKSPLAVEARFWKAECLFQMQRYKEALKLFEKFVDTYTASKSLKKAAFRIADCYVKMKDFDRAEYYYEKALKRWPDLVTLSSEVLNNIAMTYYYKGSFAKSRNVFFTSFNIYPEQDDRAQLLLFIGDSYQWEEDMQKSLNLYGYLMDMFRGSDESVIAAMRAADLGVNIAGLDSSYVAFKDFNPYREPERTYRWVIKSGKTGDILTEAFYKLGFTLAKKGSYAEAVTFFKRAMYQKEQGIYYKRSFENIQRILVKMINNAADKERYFKAVELYKQHEDPFLEKIDDCVFFNNVGNAYYKIGLTSFAEGIFEKLIQNTSNEELCRQKAIIRISRVELENGDSEKAKERLSILLYGDQKPSRTIKRKAEHVLGDVYYYEKNYKAAMELYASATRTKARTYRYALSLFRLGESFGKAGYYYNGVKALKEYIDLSESIDVNRDELAAYAEQAHLLMGEYLYAKQNYRAAIVRFEKVVKISKDEEQTGWAYSRWGDALMELKDYESARDLYEQVFERMPYSYLGVYAQSKVQEIDWQQKMQSDLQQFM